MEMTIVEVKEKWRKELFSVVHIPPRPPQAPDLAIKHVFRLCRKVYKNATISNQRLANLIDGCLDRMHERLNIGNWKLVTIEDRRTVTLLSFYKILFCIDEDLNEDIEMVTKKIFYVVDRGLLFGAPLQMPHADLLHKAAEIIKKNSQKWELTEYKKIEQVLQRKVELDCSKYGSPIDVKVGLPIDTFYNNHMKIRKPVVLQEFINGWPAIEKWKNTDYLTQIAGHRTVPIEIGSKYTDSDWTQKLITLSDYINNYILNEQADKGYLAQHQMFDQIPELLHDFSIPDYCSLHEDDENYDLNIDKNAWFGPSGTISPLHTDPKHNLLSQVVGEKLVILFSPDDTSNLYPYPDSLLQNTSQIDPFNPDYEKFPNLIKTSPYYHILKSGEMLYIPPKWWHYVQSLSISFSISFWWN